MTRSALLALVFLFGCDGPAGDKQASGVDSGVASHDSGGVLISAVSSGAIDETPRWTVSDEPVTIIGEMPDGSSQFYRLSGVRFVGDDLIAVASDVAKQVGFFSRSGARIENLGRMGRGPGEYLHVRLVRTLDPQALVTYDALQRRVTTYRLPDVNPLIIDMSGSALGSVRPEYGFAPREFIVRISGPFPEATRSGVVRGDDHVLRMATDGRVLADYGMHASEDRVLRINAVGGLTGGEPPYRRALLLAVSDAAVYIASTGPFTIQRYDSTGTQRASIRVQRERKPVTDGMITHYRERVLSRVTDDYGIREWTMLSADDVFPEVLPAFDAMLADRAGMLWVRESIGDGEDVALWIVFGPDDHPKARVSLPSCFLPEDITESSILGVCTDADFGQQVHVYDLSRH